MHSGQLNILFVDNSNHLLQRYCNLLNDTMACNIYTANNSLEAIDRMHEQAIDLVFIDVYLKDGMGLNLLKSVKKITNQCCLVVLTDWQAPYLEEICHSFGADYFLEKSVDFEQIISLAKEINGKTQQQQFAVVNL
jgi:prepilin-type processing-associated H-X9-DG protein